MAIVIQPGLSAQAIINHVPNGPLDGAWFRDFCIKFLIHADARNAVAGAGTSISGNVGQPATIGTTGIPVTALAPIANDTVIGNVAGITAVPTALTQTQLTSLINLFGTGISGAVPSSGGGTTNFLRADGTFAAPPSGTTSPLTTKGDVWGYDTGNNRIPVGSDGTLLAAASSQALGVQWASPAGLCSKITTFDQTGGSPQSWTAQTNSKFVRVYCIGGGGGGGSGASNAATNSFGGGGGSGGGVSCADFIISVIGSTQSITFSNTSTGGNGGASKASNGGNGNPGVNGSNAQFGSLLFASGGTGGAAGTATTGTGGAVTASNGVGNLNIATGGGNGSSGAGNAGVNMLLQVAASAAQYSPTGGGGGGGCVTTPTQGAGGAGGSAPVGGFLPGATGGTAGTAGGGGGGGGNQYGFIGTGGGGGGGSDVLSTNGGAGALGGNYGGGGGGGGGATNATTPGASGKGGQGGLAAVIVVEW